LLGRALAPELRSRRHEIVIATKGGLRPNGDNGIVRDTSRAWLRGVVESSLRALGVDHIHIEDSIRAADVRLTDVDLAEIDAIMEGAVAVGGPSPETV
jgi:aryl-alcohol dehydrogenase-like predicted oxidoreductase